MSALAGELRGVAALAQDRAVIRCVTVADIRPAADGVVSVLLADPEGHELPAWEAGAHLDVRLTAEIERQYSLCGQLADRHGYLIAVLREQKSRGGSALVHSSLRVGDRISIRGPRNNFPLDPAPAYRFIAGGIGITPMLPMIAHAEAAGADWRLLYGGRTRGSMAFLETLKGYGDRVRIRPEDAFGLLDLDAEVATSPRAPSSIAAGPNALLDAVEQRCAHLPVGALRVERFAAPAPARPPATDGTIEVVCSRSGVTVEVEPDTTILAALRSAGINVESSCEEGTCGTCEVRVLDGCPDHRDYVLSEAERHQGHMMMVCCSRAASKRLVLDL